MENTMSNTLSGAEQGCRSRRAENGRRNRTSKKKSNSGLKVVYISTPMKVKTSASKFRSIVQELTGKYSDVARYMENNVIFYDNDVKDSWISAADNNNDGRTTEAIDDRRLAELTPFVSEDVFHESPTSSDSLYNEHQFDGTLDLPDNLEMNLEGIFGSNFMLESTLDDITFEDFCVAA